MKKTLMILASVALGTAIASAQTNVESKNIVGFGQSTFNSQYWLVGCNFQSMDGSNTLSVQEMFPLSELYANPDGDPDLSDQISVYDGAGYQSYVFCNFSNEGDPQWYESDFSGPTEKRFARGEAFWFKRSVESTATTLTLSGQVPLDSSFPHADLPTGYFIFANAYPNVTALNSSGINAYANPDGDPDLSDQISVYDGAGYQSYVFCNFGNEGDPQWYESDFSAPTLYGLPVGQSAWYKRSAEAGSDATWTEEKPY